jgi:predicted dehydrogenase
MPVLASRDDVKIVSACTLGSSKLALLKEMFGVEVATEDYAEALAPGVDVAVVASPAGFHFEHSMAAMESGAHVMCEKPFTVTPSDAWELERTANRLDKHLLIPYGWNYSRMAAAGRRLIAGVGDIEMMVVHFAAPLRELLLDGRSYRGSWMRDGEEVRVHPAFQMEAATYQDPKLAGGGFAHVNVTHALGMALWLTSLRGRSVFARMHASTGTGADLHDAMTVELDGGVIATVSGASAPDGADRHQLDIRVYGTEGQLHLDFERDLVSLVRGPRDQITVDLEEDEGRYDCSQPANVIVDLSKGRQGIENKSPAELGARVVEVLDAAYRSARDGNVAEVDRTLATA